MRMPASVQRLCAYESRLLTCAAPLPAPRARPPLSAANDRLSPRRARLATLVTSPGDVMDRRLGNSDFKIPASSISFANTFGVLLTIPL